MNKVILIGRLVENPIKKVTTTQKTICSLTLAVNDSRNHNETYFIPCTAWTNVAEQILSYYSKGDLVEVDGRLTRRSYLNKESKNTYVTEVVIESISGLSKNQKNNTTVDLYDSLTSTNSETSNDSSSSKQEETQENEYNKEGGII